MGTLLYFDGGIAVCDYDGTADDIEHVVKLLLAFDKENSDMDKHVKPLLASDCLFHGLWNSSPEDLGLAKLRANALKELGFEMADSNMPRLTPEALEECSRDGRCRKLLIVRQEMTRISELADALQYLARLYLLANGDERSSCIVPHVIYEDYRIEPLDIELPGYFIRFVTGQSLNTNITFDYKRNEGTTRITVCGKIGRYLDKGCSTREYEFQLKRIVAAFLLQALVNYTSALPFSMDDKVPMIKRDDSRRFTSTLADLMLDGKIDSCPWCGRPVMRPRKSSKPFCRQSHQTRYNEKARVMLNGGASIDEVSEAFPFIQYATICGWLPD